MNYNSFIENTGLISISEEEFETVIEPLFEQSGLDADEFCAQAEYIRSCEGSFDSFINQFANWLNVEPVTEWPLW